jgi:hypothetical protein
MIDVRFQIRDIIFKFIKVFSKWNVSSMVHNCIVSRASCGQLLQHGYRLVDFVSYYTVLAREL